MKAEKRLYSRALRIGLLELLIVLLGMIFVHREIYTKGQFSSLALHWQDYALLTLCFIDGIVRGAFDARDGMLHISPLCRKVLRRWLPVTLFLYVSCAVLCLKLNVASLSYEWSRDLGLAIMLLSVYVNYRSCLTVPVSFVDPKSDGKDLQNGLKFPWRRLCYPERFSVLFMLLGISLALGSWLPLLALPGVFIVLKWELADIESFRISQIGDPYLAYRKDSWCLLPFIY